MGSKVAKAKKAMLASLWALTGLPACTAFVAKLKVAATLCMISKSRSEFLTCAAGIRITLRTFELGANCPRRLHLSSASLFNVSNRVKHLNNDSRKRGRIWPRDHDAQSQLKMLKVRSKFPCLQWVLTIM